MIRSPMIQQLLKRKYEVLLMDQPIDEFAVNNLTEFEGVKMKNISKGDLRFNDETELERKKEKKIRKIFEPLTKWFKTILKDEVETVTISRRLVSEPLVAVASEYGFTANMERIQNAQAIGNKVESHMKAKKTLEVNPNHTMIQKLLDIIGGLKADEKNDEAEDMAWMM